LADKSIQTVVTSPPYWGLRDYGTKSWLGGDEGCTHVKDKTKTKTFGNEEFNKNRPSRELTKLLVTTITKAAVSCVGLLKKMNR
jgi:DNA modification methylase